MNASSIFIAREIYLPEGISFSRTGLWNGLPISVSNTKGLSRSSITLPSSEVIVIEPSVRTRGVFLISGTERNIDTLASDGVWFARGIHPAINIKIRNKKYLPLPFFEGENLDTSLKKAIKMNPLLLSLFKRIKGNLSINYCKTGEAITPS